MCRIISWARKLENNQWKEFENRWCDSCEEGNELETCINVGKK